MNANRSISRRRDRCSSQGESPEDDAEHHVLDAHVAQPTMLAMSEITDPVPVFFAATGRPTNADRTNTARPYGAPAGTSAAFGTLDTRPRHPYFLFLVTST